jgi:hypothetical protein
MKKASKANARHADLAGAPPKLATLDDLEIPTVAKPGRAHASNKSSSTKRGGELKINLKAVAQALVDEGYDPAVEIISILKKQVPVYDNNGVPRFDQVTKKPIMRDALDPDTKLRMLNEMLQYTQPKLKAVEMKISGHLDLTNEQLDSRLEMLFAKAMK